MANESRKIEEQLLLRAAFDLNGIDQDVDAEDLLHHLARALGVEGLKTTSDLKVSEIQAMGKKGLEDHLCSLLLLISDFFYPKSREKILSPRVRVVDSYDVSAMTLLDDPTEPLILFNIGLLSYAQDIGKMIAARFELDNNFNPIGNGLANQSELKTYINQVTNVLCHFISSGKWFFGPMIIDLKSEQQRAFAGLIRDAFELFIMGHEVAHVYLNHYKFFNERVQIDDQEERLSLEFEADQWCQIQLSRIRDNLEDVGWVFGLGGVIALSAFELLEEAQKNLPKVLTELLPKDIKIKQFYSNHPSTKKRKEKLLEMTDLPVFISIENFFIEAIETDGKFGKKMTEHQLQWRHLIVETLDLLRENIKDLKPKK